MSDGTERSLWQQGISLFGEVTGLIVIPILAALYGGKSLDTKFDTEPMFFLGLTALAILLSTFSIIRIALRYMKDIEKNSHVRDDRNPGNKPS